MVRKRYTEEQKTAVPHQVGMVTQVRKWQRRLGVSVRSSRHITAHMCQRPHYDLGAGVSNMRLSMTAEAERWHTLRIKTAGKLPEWDWMLRGRLLSVYRKPNAS